MLFWDYACGAMLRCPLRRETLQKQVSAVLPWYVLAYFMSCGGFVTRAAPGLPYTPGNFDERLAFTVQSIIMLSTVLVASGYEGQMLWSRSYDGASLLAY